MWKLIVRHEVHVKEDEFVLGSLITIRTTWSSTNLGLLTSVAMMNWLVLVSVILNSVRKLLLTSQLDL